MATAAQDGVFAEHLSVIAALRDNYARAEDASAVAGLVRAQQDVAAACSQREEQVKDAIKGAWPPCSSQPCAFNTAPPLRAAAAARACFWLQCLSGTRLLI